MFGEVSIGQVTAFNDQNIIQSQKSPSKWPVVSDSQCDAAGKELKIEGFIASQNLHSTKNSSYKQPLKIKKQA